MDAALQQDPALPTGTGQMADAAPLTADIMEEAVHSIEDAIARVMKEALVENGVKCGLNQVVKAIEAEMAHVVFLAENVEEQAIAQAITLLAKSHKIPVIKVPDSKELGRWAGLCKIDREGQARKIVGASSAAIVKYGAKSAAYDYLTKHIQSMGPL